MTISEAEAEPPLISTTIGMCGATLSPEASKYWRLAGWRPTVDTIGPLAISHTAAGLVVAWMPRRLKSRVAMAAVGEPLTHHLAATLCRQLG